MISIPSPRGRNLRICPRTGGARRAGRIRRSLSRSGRRWRVSEQNQGYGFGTNSMTEGEKSRLIYGSLAFFFLFFIAGYLID